MKKLTHITSVVTISLLVLTPVSSVKAQEYLEHAPQLNNASGLPSRFELQEFESTEEACKQMLMERRITHEVFGGNYKPVILKNGRQKTYNIEGVHQPVVLCRIAVEKQQ